MVSILPELLLWQQTKPLIDGDGGSRPWENFPMAGLLKTLLRRVTLEADVEFMSPTFGSLRDEVCVSDECG